MALARAPGGWPGLAALVVLVAAALLLSAADALRVIPETGPTEWYDSALITFGHDPASFASVTAPLVEVNAAGGCVVENPLGLQNNSIATSKLAAVLIHCKTYSQFLRQLQQIPGILGALVHADYNMPGWPIKDGSYWLYNENTDDIRLIVNEVSALAWDELSGRVAKVNVTLTQERGSYFDQVVNYDGTKALFYLEGVLYIIFEIFDVWFLISIIKRTKRIHLHAVMVFISIIFCGERIFGNFLAEPDRPTLAFYFEIVLFWMNVVNGLMLYTMLILQWSKTVHILRGSNFLIRHEMKILLAYTGLIFLVGLFQTLRYTSGWNTGLILSTVILAVLVLVECILLFIYGFKILFFLIQGAAIQQRRLATDPNANASELAPVSSASKQKASARSLRIDTKVAVQPPQTIREEEEGEEERAEKSRGRERSGDTDVSGIPSSGAVVTSSSSLHNNSINNLVSLKEELKKNALNRNLTILILVAGLGLFLTCIFSFVGGLAGTSPGLYYGPAFFFGFEVTKWVCILMVERSIIFYLFLVHWKRAGLSEFGSSHSGPNSPLSPHPSGGRLGSHGSVEGGAAQDHRPPELGGRKMSKASAAINTFGRFGINEIDMDDDVTTNGTAATAATSVTVNEAEPAGSNADRASSMADLLDSGDREPVSPTSPAADAPTLPELPELPRITLPHAANSSHSMDQLDKQVTEVTEM